MPASNEELEKLVREFVTTTKARYDFSDARGHRRHRESDTAVIAAQEHVSKTYHDAKAEFDAATLTAKSRLAEIENEAEAAKTAVLVRHEAELTTLRGTLATAYQVHAARNATAEKALSDARNVAQAGEHQRYLVVVEKAYHARLALALALLGGPARLPAKVKIGHQRTISVYLKPGVGMDGPSMYLPSSTSNPRLVYDLRAGYGGVSKSAYIRLLVPLPPMLRQKYDIYEVELVAPMRDDLQGPQGTQGNANFVEAIQKAEDAGIAAGWLVR